MATLCRIIDSIDYIIFFDNDILVFKAIDLQSSLSYKCELSNNSLNEYKIFSSLEKIYEIMTDFLNEINNDHFKITINKDPINKVLLIQIDYQSKNLYETIIISLNQDTNIVLTDEIKILNNKVFDLETKLKNVLERLESLENNDVIWKLNNVNDNFEHIFVKDINKINIHYVKQYNNFTNYSATLYKYDPTINETNKFKPICIFNSKQKLNVNLLSKFVNLTHLELSGDYWTNLDFVKDCKKLEYVELYDCRNLKNVDGLANLSSLVELKMYYLPNIDIINIEEILWNCKTLQKISIQKSNTKLVDRIRMDNKSFILTLID